MKRRKQKKLSFLAKFFGGARSGYNYLEDDLDIIDDSLYLDTRKNNNYEDDEYEDEGDLEIEEKPILEAHNDLNINLIDGNDSIMVVAIVPGVSEEEIDIELNREMLTITTKSNQASIDEDGDYLYEELLFGSFSRSILLPAEVSIEDSDASVKDGVLTVRMPKLDKAKHKKISVKKK